MATKTNFYFDGSLINPPKNWQELELELNFDKDRQLTAPQVSVNEWELVRENAGKVEAWVNDGLTTGPGIFEGVPFRIEIDRNGVIEKPFDGYLDITEASALSCNRATVPAKERAKIDWLNDVADGFTFEYLESIGVITAQDYKQVPYVINSVPSYKDAAISLLGAYVMSQELKRVGQEFAELFPQLSNIFETASTIIRAILKIAYVISLVIAMVKLIVDLINFLIQPVKYHACMNLKTLLEKGAAHLGLTFKSDELNKAPFDKLTIMPERFSSPANSKNKQILGFTIPTKSTEVGYFRGTFGDLLRAVKLMFNAKIIIDDNREIQLIRRDINTGTAAFTIPPIDQKFYNTNASEFISNYLISFDYDTSDKNTIQGYTGTSFQVVLQPQIVKNKELVLMKNLEQVNIPLALAKRKESLTVPEVIVDGFLTAFSLLVNVIVVLVNGIISVANVVIKVINKIIKALKVVGIKVNWQIKPIPKLKATNLGNLIDNRVGMMLLENDQFTRPKVFLLDEGSQAKFNKLTTSNASTVTAKYFYDNYHFVNSFYPEPGRPNGNQYIITEYERVPFCFDDYQSVKSSNFVFNSAGNPVEIESLTWNPYKEQANIRVRENKLYTKNLVKTELEPNGQ